MEDQVMSSQPIQLEQEEEKKEIAAEALGDVSSRHGIEDTAYQMVSTSAQTFGMIRNMDGSLQKFDFASHKPQYDKIANFVVEFVQKKMVETYMLREVWIPENKHIEEKYHGMPKANIFMSREFKQPKPVENKGRRALVLIQGTGAVRAGIWARSVCINENLELGSMLPFIDVCRDLNIPVLVMNPNLNSDPETGVAVPYSTSMAEHACYVWDKYVKDSGFDQISVVAHSAGGGCVTAIQQTFADTFCDQVCKIAFTDSWTIHMSQLTREQHIWMFKNAMHYEASDKELGTVLSADAQKDVCPQLSAGHVKHEYTTGTSQKMILTQFGYDIPVEVEQERNQPAGLPIPE